VLFCCSSEDPQAQNPFGDDDADHWDNYDNPLIDDGGEGVPIRALYDYDGEEEDELSFKVGKCHKATELFSVTFCVRLVHVTYIAHPCVYKQ